MICDECRTDQIDGSIYCHDCGAYLLAFKDKEVEKAEEIKNQVSQINIPGKQTGKRSEKLELALLILDTQDTIYLSDKDVYTLGRFSEGQSILPDVDLSLFQAYEKGVSRLHAAIRTGSSEFVLSDLGSVNGTKINGVKIMPIKAYPLHNQDIVELAKLKMRVILS
jgi:pSer/pThr/pTyr-binding forkhead associated (FHA) protein